MSLGEYALADLAMKHGWPNCAKCHHPVDYCKVEQDLSTRSLIVTAICHREAETVKVALVDLVDGNFRLDGDAFVGPHSLPGTTSEK